MSVPDECIAVIVPVYNLESYISECLESLLKQTYPHWVAYVIDDGSTDESSQIVDECAAKDCRFKVFHKLNGGLSSARNLALEKIGLALQDYSVVAFLDGDDWLDTHAYSDLLPKMLSEKSDILFFGFKHAFPDRVSERKFVHLEGRVSRRDFVEAVFSYGDWSGKNGSWGVVWNKFFRIEVIDGLRFIEDKTVNEDELFCVQASLKAKNFCFVNRSYCFYRQREGSLLRATGFDAKLERGRLLALSVLDESSIDEKEALQERIRPAMLDSFFDSKRKGFRQFFKDGDVLAKVAEEVLPIAEERYRTGVMNDADYRLIRTMALAHRLTNSGERQSSDFLSGLSPVEELSVQLMLDEIEILKGERELNKKLLRENKTGKDIHKKLVQENRSQAENIEKLLDEIKVLKAEKAWAQKLEQGNSERDKKIKLLQQKLSRQESFQKALQSFNISQYLKHRILSKLTFGNARLQHREKYQEQKKLYRAIKKGRF